MCLPHSGWKTRKSGISNLQTGGIGILRLQMRYTPIAHNALLCQIAANFAENAATGIDPRRPTEGIIGGSVALIFSERGSSALVGFLGNQ